MTSRDDVPPGDDLDRQLRAWGLRAVAAEGQPPAIDLASTQPSDGRRRVAMTAAACAVVVIAGVTVPLIATRQDSSAPSVAAPSERTTPAPACARWIDHGRIAYQVQSLPPDVGFSLTYSGARGCVIDARAPGLRLVNADGKTVAEQGAARTGRARLVTVSKGDQISFGVDSFLGCVGVPRGTYTLRIFFGATTSRTASSVDVSSLVPTKPFRSCRQDSIGKASAITIKAR